jgi:nucleotide-binding universal stress UspA family protein
MHVKTILAATDLRPGRDLALESGVHLAAVTGAELHAVHCVPRAEAEPEAREDLRKRVPQSVRVTVATGAPHELIGRSAAAVHADVVVLGPRAERSSLTGLFGSTADKAIQSLRLPCLLANAALPEQPRRVLLALDRSDPARQAFDFTVALIRTMLARAGGLQSITVQLATISAFVKPGGSPEFMVPDLRQMSDDMTDALGETGGAVSVETKILAAPVAADGILACAESFHPDLLIMGTHGSGALSRAVLGSVAREVAQSAAVPVLLVPPPARRLMA